MVTGLKKLRGQQSTLALPWPVFCAKDHLYSWMPSAKVLVEQHDPGPHGDMAEFPRAQELEGSVREERQSEQEGGHVSCTNWKKNKSWSGGVVHACLTSARLTSNPSVLEKKKFISYRHQKVKFQRMTVKPLHYHQDQEPIKAVQSFVTIPSESLRCQFLSPSIYQIPSMKTAHNGDGWTRIRKKLWTFPKDSPKITELDIIMDWFKTKELHFFCVSCSMTILVFPLLMSTLSPIWNLSLDSYNQGVFPDFSPKH
jgi:hypothetical protein